MPHPSPGQEEFMMRKKWLRWEKRSKTENSNPTKGRRSNAIKDDDKAEVVVVVLIMKTENIEGNRGSEGKLSSWTGERKTCRRDAFDSSVTPPTPCDDRIEEAKVERRLL